MELIKTIECLHCVRFFECEGKPENVYRCVDFQIREEIKAESEESNE